MEIVEEIERIKDRNKKVEEDKAWETSTFRKFVIIALTYLTVVLFFLVANLPHPFLSALVPSAGFALSTLSLPFFKKIWVQYIK